MTRVTLIKGDGIGPEISNAVVDIIKASGAEIEWDVQTAGTDVIETEGVPLPQRVLDSVKQNGVALKSPVTTPIGKGFRSVNVQLRKDLDLYANLRPCYNLPNVKTRYENVDIVVVRENTEDLYAGIERQVDENTAESIKIITREASERIAEFAQIAGEKTKDGCYKYTGLSVLLEHPKYETLKKFADIESKEGENIFANRLHIIKDFSNEKIDEFYNKAINSDTEILLTEIDEQHEALMKKLVEEMKEKMIKGDIS